VTDAADDAYARAALDGECAELAHAGASRNEQLNKAAFALGQFVGADRLTHGEVESALFDAAVANGDVAKDGPAAARARIKSGIENGSLEPRLNGAEPRRSEALPRNRHAAALPVAYGGALPHGRRRTKRDGRASKRSAKASRRACRTRSPDGATSIGAMASRFE
jgi:hypothetical protein